MTTYSNVLSCYVFQLPLRNDMKYAPKTERTSSMMDAVEVPIWVDGVEKWLNGLTRRTTCDDIIYALLCHEENTNNNVKVGSYAIFERWQNVERPLKGRAKIYKVWRTWGSEARNVKYVLRSLETQSGTSKPTSRRLATATDVTLDVNSETKKLEGKDGRYPSCPNLKDATNSPHIQPRLHQQSVMSQSHLRASSAQFRTTHGFSDDDDSSSDCEWTTHRAQSTRHGTRDDVDSQAQDKAYEQLLELVKEQNEKLNQQRQRIHQLDNHIESREIQIHAKRMETNGSTYLQDAYLKGDDSSSVSSSSDGDSSTRNATTSKVKQLEEYLKLCERLIETEESLTEQQSLVHDLSHQISESSMMSISSSDKSSELRTDSNQSADSHHTSSTSLSEQLAMSTITDDPAATSLQSDLEISFRLGVTQEQQLRLVNLTVDKYDMELTDKQELIDNLVMKVKKEEESTRQQNVDNSFVKRNILHHSSYQTDNLSDIRPINQQSQSPQYSDKQYYKPDYTRLNDNGMFGHTPHRSVTSDEGSFLYARTTSTPLSTSDRIYVPNTNFSLTDENIRVDFNARNKLAESVTFRHDSISSDWDWAHDKPDKNCIEKSENDVVSPDPLQAGQVMIPYKTYATYENLRQTSTSGVQQPTAGKHAPSTTTMDDSNSDTGLSSLHSDEPPPILETLV